MFDEREYQEECLLACLEADERRLLVGLPTGTGKTHIFSQLINIFLVQGKRVLVFSHREELIEQVKKSLEYNAPMAVVSVEQGSNYASLEDDVVIASIPTLGRGKTEEYEHIGYERVLVPGTNEWQYETGTLRS
jgi:ATP-dependent helicase IRC3